MKVLYLLVSLCVGTGLGAPQSQGPPGGSGGSSSSGSSSNAAAARLTRLLGHIYNDLGPKANGLSACVFPFTHNDKTHHKCTTDDDFYGMYWCSTRTDSNGVHAFNEWRHCRESDGLEGGPEVLEPSLCEDAGGRCAAIDIQTPTEDCPNGKTFPGLCGSDSEKICCIEPKHGCELGSKTYKNTEYNVDTCLQILCINGQWYYTGLINPNCTAECKVEGDPHFYMFDNTNFLPAPSNKYKFGGEGNFVITQNNINLKDSTFRVSATFKTCNTQSGRGFTCVQSLKYNEPGTTVELILPEQENRNPWQTPWPICNQGFIPITDKRCNIEVKVNGISTEPLLTGKPVHIIQATNGQILVFSHSHIKGDKDNLLCLNIVGTQGLSVSLCEHKDNFSYLYVMPMPSLKHERSSELYGLCNTYTGLTQHNFTMSGGGVTDDIDLFGKSWQCESTRSC